LEPADSTLKSAPWYTLSTPDATVRPAADKERRLINHWEARSVIVISMVAPEGELRQKA
jgi:hypothetical protein